MKEKDIQKLFGRSNTTVGVFELKLVKEKRFSFKRLAEHQEQSLLRVESPDGLAYKISDMSADRKPFDCFRLAGIPAYVVLVWYTPRKPKVAYFIRIHDFLALRDRSSMKSMTENEAKAIAERIIEL